MTTGTIPGGEPRVSDRRLPFSVLAKPTGAACNLDYTYCVFLSKELLYAPVTQRMSDEGLEVYLRNLLDAEPDDAVTLPLLAWRVRPVRPRLP